MERVDDQQVWFEWTGAAAPEAAAFVHAAYGSQAAGRDIDNRRQYFFGLPEIMPRRPDSPHLQDCPHCGRRWVSRVAMFCPGCGYSLQMAAERRERVRNGFFWHLGMAPTLAVLVSVMWDLPIDPQLKQWSQLAACFGASVAIFSTLAGAWYARQWAVLRRTGEA